MTSNIPSESPLAANDNVPQPPVAFRTHQVELDTGKMPWYETLTQEGCRVRLVVTDFGGRVRSDEWREFGSEAEAETFFHARIRENDPRYVPPTDPSVEASSQKVEQLNSVPRPAADLDITPLIRPAWKPIVTPGDGDLLASKFCGRPWLAEHESWVDCPACSEPLQLFLQLNLDELPELVRKEYGEGLLQVFFCISPNCGYQEGWQGVYYGEYAAPFATAIIRLINPMGTPSVPPIPIVSGLDEDDMLPALTITDWEQIQDYPHPDDVIALVHGWDQVNQLLQGYDMDKLMQRFGLEDSWEYECECPTYDGDKLGGYPRWIQTMQYTGCPICDAPMRQVFQFASEECLSYGFGDAGIAHVLQCKIHKEQFTMVYACG